MTALEFATGVSYLLAASLFVVGLHLMRAPSTARRGNLVSAAGMVLAVAATVGFVVATSPGTRTGWLALTAGLLVGGLYGVYGAWRVRMTDIPQLVSIFNAVGGGAAAAVAVAALLADRGGPGPGAGTAVPIVLDVLIGAMTFAGSFVAAGKLHGVIPGRPIVVPGARLLNAVVVAVAVGAGAATLVTAGNVVLLAVVLLAAMAFGVLMVLPIGGADAPVVVSLLNAFTGLAVAMAGFAVDNQAMIIAGALVGAAGTILTLQMAAAMNRSVAAIIAGGFGTGDAEAPTGPRDAELAGVRRVSADDVAIQLAYAQQVLIVPGYGLAAAQAQHEVADLAKLLTEHGIALRYAIHPVAGRMPGHMNVLLAEANVPYAQMLEIDAANAAFATCDVALVIGANDVTNPAARRPGNAVSGMPILDVDHARSVVVLKRSMSPGYADIANPLFTDPRTGMYFADAKRGLTDVITAVKQYIAA